MRKSGQSRPEGIRWNVVRRIAAGFLGVLLLASGASKLTDPDLFFIAMLEAKVLPANAAYLTSKLMPWFEILLGLWGILGWQRRVFAAFTGLLFVAFTVYLLLAVQLGRITHCACFGPFDASLGLDLAILRNFLLLGLTAFAGWKDRQQAGAGKI